MWQIYGSLGFGVAVKSSVNGYRQAARFEVDSSHYILGKVAYHDTLESAPDVRVDFSAGSIPVPGSPGLVRKVLGLGFHKRSCYWYENESRAAMYQDLRSEIAGLSETVDLEQLISAVYVGPRAEKFVADVVSSIMDKFLLRKPLIRSELLTSRQTEGASAG